MIIARMKACLPLPVECRRARDLQAPHTLNVQSSTTTIPLSHTHRMALQRVRTSLHPPLTSQWPTSLPISASPHKSPSHLLIFHRHATHQAQRSVNGPKGGPGKALGAKKSGGPPPPPPPFFHTLHSVEPTSHKTTNASRLSSQPNRTIRDSRTHHLPATR